MEASISLFAACLHYAVLSNAVFCCRPRMNSSSKACLSNPTPQPTAGGGGYRLSKLVTGEFIISEWVISNCRAWDYACMCLCL